MNRLTYKLKDAIVFDETGISYYNIHNMQEVHKSIEITNKLGELEDIEETLNPKLNLSNFLNHVFIEKISTMYLKDVGDRTYWIKYGMIFVKVKGQEYVLRFEDYGVYWALTEEEFNEFSNSNKK